MFDKYPYTDFHEMNLDWIIKEMKQLIDDWEEFSGRVSAEAHESTAPEVTITGDLKEGLDFDFGLVRGPRGVTGATGPQGERGPAGNGLEILDTYPNLAALQAAHPTGQPGDAYLVGSEGNFILYIWSESSSVWSSGGSLTSPSPSDTSPSMNGTTSAGVSSLYSRGDHVHPSDTTKLDKSSDDGVYGVESGVQVMIATADNVIPDALVRYDSVGDINTSSLNASGNVTVDGDVTCDEINVTNNAILNSQMLAAEVGTNSYRPIATINPIEPLTLVSDSSDNTPSIKFNAVSYDQSGNITTHTPEVKFTDQFTINSSDYSETRIGLTPDVYRTGDTLQIEETVISGFITSSSKVLAFSYQLPKACSGVASLALTTISTRTIAGRINVDVSTITNTAVEVRANNSLRILVTVSNALSVASNTPFSADIEGVITFA